MKAFLLAAGLGTRLRPLTDTLPKCLVPVKGEPLLGLWLNHLRQHGVTEVCINLHTGAPQVREFLRSRDWGLTLRLAEEAVLLGSAGTLAANRHWVEAEEYFGIFYADVLTNTNIGALRNFHRPFSPAATLGLYHVPDPARCGIADLNADGVVIGFVEKPQYPHGDLAFSGLMIAGPALLEALPQHVPADIGGQVLPKLVGRMRGIVLEDFVLDIGTLENYHRAQTHWPARVSTAGRRLASPQPPGNAEGKSI